MEGFSNSCKEGIFPNTPKLASNIISKNAMMPPARRGEDTTHPRHLSQIFNSHLVDNLIQKPYFYNTLKTQTNETTLFYRRLIFICFRNRSTPLQGNDKSRTTLQIDHNK